jgi:glycosyltransferase involved in cell wall biosynthesis
MNGRPAVSVIIPSYRSASTIGRCLQALSVQDVAPREIILVDSSDDETPDLVRRDHPTVTLIHLDGRTDPAAARNIGARGSAGDVLAFIDADCVAGPDWLRRLLAGIGDGCDAVGGAIANGNDDSLVSWAGYFCEFRDFVPRGAARQVENLTLGNVAYTRDAWTVTGGFPEGYFPQEDQVFHEAMRSGGFRLRLDPTIVVRHAHRDRRVDFLQHQRNIGRANARALQKVARPGALFARRRWVALFAMPALVPLRFSRTLRACWSLEGALILRRPLLAWLCWLGMCSWGHGFLEGAWRAPASGGPPWA